VGIKKILDGDSITEYNLKILACFNMNLFGSKTQTLSMIPEVAAYLQQNSQQFSSLHQTGGCQNLIQTPK
jgi:hypothetical protein